MHCLLDCVVAMVQIEGLLIEALRSYKDVTESDLLEDTDCVVADAFRSGLQKESDRQPACFKGLAEFHSPSDPGWTGHQKIVVFESKVPHPIALLDELNLLDQPFNGAHAVRLGLGQECVRAY